MPTIPPDGRPDEESRPITTAVRISMDDAEIAMNRAMARLSRWYAGSAEDVPGDNYVAAGHDTLKYIDAAFKALHTARQSLVAELLADSRERLDAFLAEDRAEGPE